MLQLSSPGSAKRWIKIILISLVGIVIAAAFCYIAFQLTRPLTSRHTSKSETVNTKKAPSVSTVKSKIMVTGDVFFSRFTNQAAMKSDLKYAYPFARLNEFHRDKYDAWVGDMECPVTNLGQPTPAEEEATLSFNCSDKYLPEMSKWFNAMTLANNHTDNRGVEGFKQTQENLEKNGVQHFGTYDPEDLSNVCDVTSLPAHITMSDNSEKKLDVPIAFCGYHGVFKIPSAESIAEITKYTKYLPVIAMPHSGAEYKAGPDEIKMNLYRSMIDAGADVVIGDHAHWVQNTEAYKGHLIMYSLGNFMFDQQFNTEVTRSVALVMDITADSKDNPDLDKWTALSESCKSYHDECLQMAAKQNLSPLKLEYVFSVVGTENMGRQTHPATQAQMDSLMTRLNWSNTTRSLTGQYSGR